MTSADRRARRRRRRRGTAWAAVALALVVGTASLTAGLVVRATPEPATPLPLDLREAVVVPARVPFAGPMVVYGTPPDGRRPSLDALGCAVTPGGGPLSTRAATAEDRVVVEGRGVVPLLSFPGREGYGIACSGPAARAAAPLHLLPGRSTRSLVPLAGFSLAALLLPLGTAAALALRSTRD